MKKLLALLLALLLCGCAADPAPTTLPPETTVPETTVPETTVPPTTVPLHSDYYLEDFTLDEVLLYFNEVVLQVEYTQGGDPTLVQKWLQPITYRIFGEPTEEDLRVLEDFFVQLNQVPGFPGIREAGAEEYSNLSLNFLNHEDFYGQFSQILNGEDAWGGYQFWYSDSNDIYDAQIGYRTDIDQLSRNSILLEEIVNALGISDTLMRSDSIVYQHSNDNLELSEVDWLLLKLLYHPDIQCGMDEEACRTVIETLYH